MNQQMLSIPIKVTNTNVRNSCVNITRDFFSLNPRLCVMILRGLNIKLIGVDFTVVSLNVSKVIWTDS